MNNMFGNSTAGRRDSAPAVEKGVSPPSETLTNPLNELSESVDEKFGEGSPSGKSHPNQEAVTTVTSSAFPITQLYRLHRSDRLFIGVTAALALTWMAVRWAQLSGWGMQPIEIEQLQPREYDYRIDINSAGWIEWVQMERIGETLATRIIEDREQNGPFENIDDLKRVKGIGPKTVEKLRPWLKVGSEGNDLESSEQGQE